MKIKAYTANNGIKKQSKVLMSVVLPAAFCLIFVIVGILSVVYSLDVKLGIVFIALGTIIGALFVFIGIKSIRREPSDYEVKETPGYYNPYSSYESDMKSNNSEYINPYAQQKNGNNDKNSQINRFKISSIRIIAARLRFCCE